jgi:RNA polymerase sigma-70 factor (ECF subfamily)
LVKLFQQLPRYHHDPARGQFRGWLKTVVNNILTDFWRRQERQPECNAIGGSEFLQHLACLANPESAGELSGLIDDRAQTTASEVLHRVRAKLKETTWQAFHQSMVDHLPAAEVAEKLNLSIASVYKATYRVKQMLIEEYRHAYSPSSLSDALSRSRDTQETPV